MLRREARLRREYLYKKSLEEKERALFEKKQALKQALEQGKPVPRQLRDDSEALARELVYDPNIQIPNTHVDDEYANATLADPKIVITTSRNPSSRLIKFCKELRLVFPNSQTINRGHCIIPQLVQTCKDNDVSDLILLHETRGAPDNLVICHLPYGPTAHFSLHNVMLRHDVPDRPKVSQSYPHLIFNGFSTKLGERTRNILKHLFPVPKPDSKRVMTFSNDGDYISFRHHIYNKKSHKEVALVELGPRFELRLYQIKLGTVDIVEAESEWVLRPYMNTAKKRNVL